MPMTSDQAAQPPTFAMLMPRIAADSELSDTRRKSLLTSIRCFARLLGRDPARMTVDLGLYSKVIASFRPARHKLTKARWSNICCDLRYVLKYAGVAGVPGRNLTPPSAPWRQPLATVEDRVGRASLARFARWATGDGVEEPMMVTAELLERYHAGLLAHDVNSRGKAAWCRFLQAWNREATTNPAWPKVTLPRARHLNRWTTPLDRLPEPLRREVDDFLAWSRRDDPFAAHHDPFAAPTRRKRRRPATIEGWGYLFRAYIAAAVESGIPLERLTSLQTLVEPETAKAGLRRLLARSPTRSYGRAHKVACLLKVVARDYLQLDQNQVEAIAALCRRLVQPIDGLHPKNRERLAPFDNPRCRRRLLDLPRVLMRRARADDDGTRRHALTAQIAVAIELLIMAPVRIGNLISLRLDRHLAPLPGRGAPGRLAIPGEEVKNKLPLDFVLPAETAELIATYCRGFRDRLTVPDNPFLFPGRGQGHKHVAGLAEQITRAIREEVGVEVHPHLFRHLAAKIQLEAQPGSYETVRRLLGHTSLDTTVAFYAGSEMTAAARHYDETILGLRRGSPAARGRQR
jgi:integrase